MYLGQIVEITQADLSRQQPAHPYTKILMDSVFVADPGAKKVISAIEGEIPSPFDLPQGCSFENRCKYARPLCKKQAPELHEIHTGKFVACHFPLN